MATLQDRNDAPSDDEHLEMDPLQPKDKRTRFQVNRVRTESYRQSDQDAKGGVVVVQADGGTTTEDDQTDDDDDGNLHSSTDRTRLNSESDTKYAKSFRHLTREALPRLENYKNIMSLHAANRPSLDELHNATLTNKVGE